MFRVYILKTFFVPMIRNIIKLDEVIHFLLYSSSILIGFLSRDIFSFPDTNTLHNFSEKIIIVTKYKLKPNECKQKQWNSESKIMEVPTVSSFWGIESLTNMSIFSNDSSNATTKHLNEILHLNHQFKPIIDYLLVSILIIIMLSMGCEITWSQLKAHLKMPIGIGIGMVSQFFIMPLCAYSLMRSINITGLHATGILIISCCPGGVLSNAFTYFAEGDLSLSVAMTSISTLMAMGMMPFNLWIYGRSFETKDLSLPYGNLAISLVSVTSPVAVGMFLRWKFPKIAHFITKVGSYVGIFIVIACIVLEVIVFPDMFTDVPGKLYGVILSLPCLGMCLGYVLAFSFRQNMPVRKTIAIECGVQNVPTALTVISLSFKTDLQADIILLPWLYGFAMITCSITLCIVYHIHKRYKAHKAKKEKVFQLDVVVQSYKNNENFS